MKLSACIVVYNGYDEALKAAQTVLHCTRRYPVTLYLVDNASPDGSGARLITSGYLVEAPVWAPNGRVLMYFRQDKGTSRSNAPVKLYTIDLTGYNERMIVTPADASDPAWSPLLP